MAEENEVIEGEEQAEELESKAAAEVQAQAKRIGWIPPDRYKGDPEKFVDADEFLKRGEEILPIVKHQKAQLEAKVSKLASENAKMAELLVKNQEAMDALEKYHTSETKRKVEEVRKQLKAELARASEAGDHVAVAEATDQLTQLNAKAEEADEAPARKRPAAEDGSALSPEFVEWAEETGWYGKDRRRTALANAVAAELRQNGEETKGREFLDLVREEVEATLPLSGRRPNPGKTNGGTPRSGGGGGSSRKTYADLPTDAKAACDSYNRDLVGEGRRFKDLASWRASYTKQYFEEA